MQLNILIKGKPSPAKLDEAVNEVKKLGVIVDRVFPFGVIAGSLESIQSLAALEANPLLERVQIDEPQDMLGPLEA